MRSSTAAAARGVFGVLILLGSWRLLREPFNVLMESAPEGIDVQELGQAMCVVPGVREVHDLHVWTVTSGFAAVAAHVTVASSAEPSLVRRRMAEMLERHFGVTHSTLQVEREGAEGAEVGAEGFDAHEIVAIYAPSFPRKRESIRRVQHYLSMDPRLRGDDVMAD